MRRDCWVEARSDDELIKQAENYHDLLNPKREAPASVTAMRDRACSLSEFGGLEIIIQDKSNMLGNDGFTIGRRGNSNPRIFFESDVYNNAKDGHPRSRFTVMHELAHVILHPNIDRPRTVNVSRISSTIPPANSAERQADVFAAAILAPSYIIENVSSVDELSKRSGLSLTASKIRWTSKRTQKNVRLIEEIARRIRSDESPLSRKLVQKEATEIEAAAWAGALSAEGEKPADFRLSTSLKLVARTHLRTISRFGWFEQRGGSDRGSRPNRRSKHPR